MSSALSSALPPVLPAESLLLVPLIALFLAAAPALEPVRRAFLTPRPALKLAPGESVLAEFKPDRAILVVLTLTIFGATLIAALAEQVVLGAEIGTAYLVLMPFTVAALLYLASGMRAGWIVTDRRIVTDLGASLPLAEIKRIAIGPAMLRLDGQGNQSLRLTGIADAHRCATMIQHTLHSAVAR